MFTDRRQQRQPNQKHDHILCLLTEDNNPIIIRPHIVFTDGRQQRQSNHNTTDIVFTDGRQ